MLVVTTSVATAATDTAAAPVSSSQSHFSMSLVFSMLIQCGHGCLLELRTLVIFLLVVFEEIVAASLSEPVTARSNLSFS